jgi:DnaK suppressor protein
MDKKRLKMFHDRLMMERAALRGVVGRNEDYGREADIGTTQDPADQESNSYTKEMLFHLSTNDRQILIQIDEALQRIKDEEYGVCANCGKKIGQKRLEAFPWARFCVDCQDLYERGLLDDDDVEQLNEQTTSFPSEGPVPFEEAIAARIAPVPDEKTTSHFSESRRRLRWGRASSLNLE